MTTAARKLTGMTHVWCSLGLVLGALSSAGAASLPVDTVITGHQGWTTGAALSPDGRQLALVSRSTVYLTDLNTGRQTPLPGHLGPVTRVAYSPDGQVLFTGGNDGTLKRWAAPTGRLLSSVQACGALKGARAGLKQGCSRLDALLRRAASGGTERQPGPIQVGASQPLVTDEGPPVLWPSSRSAARRSQQDVVSGTPLCAGTFAA